MSPIELLSAVNEFYDQAFNRLLAITFGILAFIGVLVPIIVGWVQVRSLRQEKGSLLAELRSEIHSERAELREAIEANVREEMQILQRELEQRVEKLSSDLKESSALAEARSFHLQGLNFIRAKDPKHAVSDLVSASINYLVGKSEANAQRCISLVYESCLPEVDRDQYAEFKMEKSCKKLLKKLEEANENGRYADHIQEIERQMERSAARAPKAEVENGA